jgi:hypothetical protein
MTDLYIEGDRNVNYSFVAVYVSRKGFHHLNIKRHGWGRHEKHEEGKNFLLNFSIGLSKNFKKCFRRLVC